MSGLGKEAYLDTMAGPAQAQNNGAIDPRYSSPAFTDPREMNPMPVEGFLGLIRGPIYWRWSVLCKIGWALNGILMRLNIGYFALLWLSARLSWTIRWVISPKMVGVIFGVSFIWISSTP